MLLRSIIFGYLGSVAAGLAVAILGVSFGLSEATIVAIASPMGIVCGLLGLAFAWRHNVLAMLRSVPALIGR